MRQWAVPLFWRFQRLCWVDLLPHKLTEGHFLIRQNRITVVNNVWEWNKIPTRSHDKNDLNLSLVLSGRQTTLPATSLNWTWTLPTRGLISTRHLPLCRSKKRNTEIIALDMLLFVGGRPLGGTHSVINGDKLSSDHADQQLQTPFQARAERHAVEM